MNTCLVKRGMLLLGAFALLLATPGCGGHEGATVAARSSEPPQTLAPPASVGSLVLNSSPDNPGYRNSGGVRCPCGLESAMRRGEGRKQPV